MDIPEVTTFTHDIAVAQRLLAAIDDELLAVTTGCMTANDTGPALRRVEQIIDQRLGNFRKHPLMGPVICEMKQQYQRLILDRQRPVQSAGLRLLPSAQSRPVMKGV